MGDTACLQNNPFYCHEKPPVVSCWGLRSQKCLNLILLHCWKRHSRHFPVILSSRRLFFNCFCFCFLLFIFFWAAELWRRYLVRGIKVLLDTSLPQKFWYGSSGSTKSESITTVPENSGKRIGGTMILPLASL